MMDATKIHSFNAFVRMMYAYSTPEIARHDGWLKIGDTEQGEVVERIAARNDDDCRCCEALAWEPTTYRQPCYALCGAVVAVLNIYVRAPAVAHQRFLRAERPYTGTTC